ncbi:MAG: hypothetical protein EBS48_08750, partial [Actinobacteria bacterium]|nr:hypothetical protein [Actinomycetota bacterium]
ITGLFDTKNIGTTKTVQIAGVTKGGGDAGNYVITQPTATADITAKTLTVTGITAANKIYDASRTANVTANNPAFVGVESGDTVTIDTSSITGLFATADVGSSIPVQIAGVAKSGGDAGNYVITQPTLTAGITQASPGLTWSTPAAITFGTSLGAAHNNATASVTGNYVYSPVSGTRLDAGTHTLSVTFTPTSSNYASGAATVQIQVNPRDLTVTATDVDITYGGTVTPGFSVSGLSSPDSIGTVSYAFAGTGSTTYASSATAPTNAGSYTVTPSAASMSAGSLANYSVTYVAGDLTIARAAQGTLVATAGSTVLTYSAPTKATTTLGTTGGSGDGAVSFAVVGGPGSACSINGTTLTVESAGTCEVTATKAQGTNHLATTSAPIAFTLNKASQTVSLAAVSDRTYGDASFSVTTSSSSGLTVSLQVGPSSVCDNPSGHTVRIVSVGSCTIDAVQSGNGNYLSAATQSRTFAVNPKTLTVSGLSASNRVYDGSTSATALIAPHLPGAALNGVESPNSVTDSVTIDASALSASFATKSVGTAKPISVSGLSLSGAHAHRYVLSQPTGLTANVTRRAVTVTGVTVVTRRYDSTTVATLDTSAASLVGVLQGDAVVLDASSPNAEFADPNASPNQKTVTTPGLTLAGGDSGNYSFTLPTLLGTINKATASVIFAATRTVTYNGSAMALASTTSPPSLSVITKYTGTGSTTYPETVQAPTNAGTFSVNGTVNETNYEGSATAAWTIAKAPTVVSVDPTHLSRVFDGTARPPATATSPAGKSVSVTYTGTGETVYSSPWAPTNAGTYRMTTTVQEANFEGS